MNRNPFQTPKRHSLIFISLTLVLGMGCASPGKRTAIGAGAGAAGGAVIGGIAGGGKGAVIGAGVGAAVGGIVGNRLDKQAQELEEVAETKRTADGILVNLKNDLLFPTGSSTLKPEAVAQLNELSAILVKYPTNHITIAGHTDDTGSASTNQALSTQRAAAVEQILVRNGVKIDQIHTQGFGESRPTVANSNSSNRAKNRRVELYITDTEAAQKAAE